MSAFKTENISEVKALKTPYKPLSLIGAGAGSGKTFHIQKTVTEWITEGSIQADRILAVTFTNAAASEMRERIRLALMANGLFDAAAHVRNAQISTIHGFGLSLIERFSYEQGLSPMPRQLTEAEQDVLIKLSLSDVSIIESILDDLAKWGYKGKYNGHTYTSAVEKLRSDVSEVIKKLRILSMDTGTDDLERLAEHAASFLKHIYREQPFKEETLNQTLWAAVQAITAKYSRDELLAEWTTKSKSGNENKAERFVKSLYTITEEKLSCDWALWSSLQTPDSFAKIFRNKNGEKQPVHDDAELAFNLWDAADKLTYHPGPLRQALEHIDILLRSAMEVLQQYQQLKAESSLVDFGDMVNLSEQLLEQDAWLGEIKNQYDCIIIDEFQDTNPLQFSLLWKVQQVGIPALIVGDVKQSIMGFQGADVRLFSSLLNENPDNTDELVYNWRSSAGVMCFVNALGDVLYGDQYQSLTPMANLQSDLSPLHIVEFSEEEWSAGNAKGKLRFSTYSAQAIASEVKQLLESGGQVVDRYTKAKRDIRPNDVAVLANSHSKLASYSAELRDLGIYSQVQQQGWFESDMISFTWYALSYLADPSDRYAQMCIKVLYSQEATLQDSLSEYILQTVPEGETKVVTSKVVDDLTELSKAVKYASVKQTVVSCIETLKLFDTCTQVANGEQERANILKLISLAEVFENTQPETLEALGVFGRSLSSFLLWLSINVDETKDFNTQPDVDSHNENAVVLSTWHASKGLEWPVVLVGELEKEFSPSLPNKAVAYQLADDCDENSTGVVNAMLENAYAQIIPSFDDATQKERFLDELEETEINTLKNLCYVAMTRAREQLILPWFDRGKEGNMLSFLREIDIHNIEGLDVKTTYASMLETDATSIQQALVKPYGRAGLEPKVIEKPATSRISPSGIADTQPVLISDTLSQFTKTQSIDYNAVVDLNVIRKGYAANVVGDWVHYSYQVLLARPDLKDRLFVKLDDLKDNPEVIEAISHQVAAFKQKLEQELGAISFKAEVPILNITGNDALVSDIIDCLVELPKGYLIVDHKTDENMGKMAFEHHTKQLAAYAKYLELDKPVLGIAINWIRNGQMELLKK